VRVRGGKTKEKGRRLRNKAGSTRMNQQESPGSTRVGERTRWRKDKKEGDTKDRFAGMKGEKDGHSSPRYVERSKVSPTEKPVTRGKKKQKERRPMKKEVET